MTPGVTSEEDPCLQVCSGSSDLALAWAALQGNEDTPCQRSHGPSTPTLCALGVPGTLAAGTLAVGATSVDSLFPCLPLGLTSRRPRQKWGDGGQCGRPAACASLRSDPRPLLGSRPVHSAISGGLLPTLLLVGFPGASGLRRGLWDILTVL